MTGRLPGGAARVTARDCFLPLERTLLPHTAAPPETTCCFCDFIAGDATARVDEPLESRGCSHAHHRSCLRQWLMTQRCNPVRRLAYTPDHTGTCPNCRAVWANFPPGEASDIVRDDAIRTGLGPVVLTAEDAATLRSTRQPADDAAAYPNPQQRQRPVSHRLDNSDDSDGGARADTGYVQGEIHVEMPHFLSPSDHGARSMPPAEALVALTNATEPDVVAYAAHEPSNGESGQYTGDNAWLAITTGSEHLISDTFAVERGRREVLTAMGTCAHCNQSLGMHRCVRDTQNCLWHEGCWLQAVRTTARIRDYELPRTPARATEAPQGAILYLGAEGSSLQALRDDLRARDLRCCLTAVAEVTCLGDQVWRDDSAAMEAAEAQWGTRNIQACARIGWASNPYTKGRQARRLVYARWDAAPYFAANQPLVRQRATGATYAGWLCHERDAADFKDAVQLVKHTLPNSCSIATAHSKLRGEGLGPVAERSSGCYIQYLIRTAGNLSAREALAKILARLGETVGANGFAWSPSDDCNRLHLPLAKDKQIELLRWLDTAQADRFPALRVRLSSRGLALAGVDDALIPGLLDKAGLQGAHDTPNLLTATRCRKMSAGTDSEWKISLATTDDMLRYIIPLPQASHDLVLETSCRKLGCRCNLELVEAKDLRTQRFVAAWLLQVPRASTASANTWQAAGGILHIAGQDVQCLPAGQTRLARLWCPPESTPWADRADRQRERLRCGGRTPDGHLVYLSSTDAVSQETGVIMLNRCAANPDCLLPLHHRTRLHGLGVNLAWLPKEQGQPMPPLTAGLLNGWLAGCMNDLDTSCTPGWTWLAETGRVSITEVALASGQYMAITAAEGQEIVVQGNGYCHRIFLPTGGRCLLGSRRSNGSRRADAGLTDIVHISVEFGTCAMWHGFRDRGGGRETGGGASPDAEQQPDPPAPPYQPSAGSNTPPGLQPTRGAERQGRQLPRAPTRLLPWLSDQLTASRLPQQEGTPDAEELLAGEILLQYMPQPDMPRMTRLANWLRTHALEASRAQPLRWLWEWVTLLWLCEDVNLPALRNDQPDVYIDLIQQLAPNAVTRNGRPFTAWENGRNDMKAGHLYPGMRSRSFDTRHIAAVAPGYPQSIMDKLQHLVEQASLTYAEQNRNMDVDPGPTAGCLVPPTLQETPGPAAPPGGPATADTTARPPGNQCAGAAASPNRDSRRRSPSAGECRPRTRPRVEAANLPEPCDPPIPAIDPVYHELDQPLADHGGPRGSTALLDLCRWDNNRKQVRDDDRLPGLQQIIQSHGGIPASTAACLGDHGETTWGSYDGHILIHTTDTPNVDGACSEHCKSDVLIYVDILRSTIAAGCSTVRILPLGQQAGRRRLARSLARQHLQAAIRLLREQGQTVPANVLLCREEQRLSGTALSQPEDYCGLNDLSPPEPTNAAPVSPGIDLTALPDGPAPAAPCCMLPHGVDPDLGTLLNLAALGDQLPHMSVVGATATDAAGVTHRQACAALAVASLLGRPETEAADTAGRVRLLSRARPCEQLNIADVWWTQTARHGWPKPQPRLLLLSRAGAAGPFREDRTMVIDAPGEWDGSYVAAGNVGGHYNPIKWGPDPASWRMPAAACLHLSRLLTTEIELSPTAALHAWLGSPAPRLEPTTSWRPVDPQNASWRGRLAAHLGLDIAGLTGIYETRRPAIDQGALDRNDIWNRSAAVLWHAPATLGRVQAVAEANAEYAILLDDRLMSTLHGPRAKQRLPKPIAHGNQGSVTALTGGAAAAGCSSR